MTKVKQNTKAGSTNKPLKVIKNNAIHKKKNDKFANTPKGKIRLINGNKIQNDSNQLRNKQKQKNDLEKKSSESPASKNISAQNNKRFLKDKKNLAYKKNKSDESLDDINKDMLSNDSIISQDDNDKVPDIFGQSLADDTDEDDTDFNEDESGEDDEDEEDEDEEDEDDEDEDEDNEDEDITISLRKGVKMFKGVKNNSDSTEESGNDYDDENYNDTDDDHIDSNEEDESDDMDESNHKTNISLLVGKNKKKKGNVNSNEEDDDDDDNDEEEDEDDDEEDNEESTPSLKDLLANSIVDDENDEDFKGDDEDDEDIDISDEESESEELEKDKRTIYISNIPNIVKKEEIKKVFKQFGHIESIRERCIVPKDLMMKKKVAAIKNQIHPKIDVTTMFVVYKTVTAAQKALSMNGKIFEGNYLRVDTADKSKKKPDSKKAVFLGNLSFTIKDNDVWEHFKQCGEIHSVRLIRDTRKGIGKGIGYVNFQSEDSVPLALELNGSTLLNREIRVKRYSTDDQSKQRFRNKNKRSLSVNNEVNKSSKKFKSNDANKTTPTENNKKKLKLKNKLQKDTTPNVSVKNTTVFQGEKATVEKKKKKKSKLEQEKKKIAAILTNKSKKAQKV